MEKLQLVKVREKKQPKLGCSFLIGFVVTFYKFCILGITCPDLDDPTNGGVDLSENTPGSTANYICNSGFVLDGLQSRKCEDNGQWSGEEPTCTGTK